MEECLVALTLGIAASKPAEKEAAGIRGVRISQVAMDRMMPEIPFPLVCPLLMLQNECPAFSRQPQPLGSSPSMRIQELKLHEF